MNYEELRKIDVSAHTEKKNGLSYLSWAWAVDTLLQKDPSASWEYREDKRYGETLMVFCTVNAFGKTRTAQLPVMDFRNKAIPNPDAFQVNTAMQRCLAKAIALHGIGLYIYAGEDIPGDGSEPEKEMVEDYVKTGIAVPPKYWKMEPEERKTTLAGFGKGAIPKKDEATGRWFIYIPKSTELESKKFMEETTNKVLGDAIE